MLSLKSFGLTSNLKPQKPQEPQHMLGFGGLKERGFFFSFEEVVQAYQRRSIIGISNCHFEVGILIAPSLVGARKIHIT